MENILQLKMIHIIDNIYMEPWGSEIKKYSDKIIIVGDDINSCIEMATCYIMKQYRKPYEISRKLVTSKLSSH